MEIELTRPNIAFESSFLAGLNEFASENEKLDWIYLGRDSTVDIPLKDFAAFVSALREREHTPAPDFVTTVCFWVIHQEEVVGRIGFRHELNDAIREVGGHIGYIVRPTYRRRTVATKMLAQVLQTPEAKRVGRLLLTCDVDNIASEKVIVRNGGVFESVVDDSPRTPKKRYWIDVTKPSPVFRQTATESTE